MDQLFYGNVCTAGAADRNGELPLEPVSVYGDQHLTVREFYVGASVRIIRTGHSVPKRPERLGHPGLDGRKETRFRHAHSRIAGSRGVQANAKEHSAASGALVVGAGSPSWDDGAA